MKYLILLLALSGCATVETGYQAKCREHLNKYYVYHRADALEKQVKVCAVNWERLDAGTLVNNEDEN